jgi:hypothetical protein
MDRDRTGTDTIRTRRRRKGRLRACYRRCPIGPEYPDTGATLNNLATLYEAQGRYLSASEIASLRLDADWVILAACNTAAGTATEALSGVARAFIYAQARALLVSHWEVYADATVKFITTALREMARDPKVGRAGALHDAGAHRQWSATRSAPDLLGAVRGGGGGRGGFFLLGFK